VGPLSPEGAQLTVKGGGCLLYGDFSLVYVVCWYIVVVVYISLWNDARLIRINQSINQYVTSCMKCYSAHRLSIGRIGEISALRIAIHLAIVGLNPAISYAILDYVSEIGQLSIIDLRK
jgi:hypothetical protein